MTTVPPLIVESSNTGPGNAGASWNFRYCPTGLEPDPNTNCTSHVQMVKDVCQAQLGDDSGTDPQQGQTPEGRLSTPVQSGYWRADPATVSSRRLILKLPSRRIWQRPSHISRVVFPEPRSGRRL
jgi:hypothetical protein